MSETKRPSIKLDCARVGDAPVIFALLWACRDEIPLKETFHSPENAKLVRDHCRRKKFFVVRRNGTIVGAMLLEANDVFYIPVREGFRRHGIARAFIRYAKTRWSSLTAKVHEGNRESTELLESEGFRPDPVRVARSGWNPYFWTRREESSLRAPPLGRGV